MNLKQFGVKLVVAVASLGAASALSGAAWADATVPSDGASSTSTTAVTTSGDGMVQLQVDQTNQSQVDTTSPSSNNSNSDPTSSPATVTTNTEAVVTKAKSDPASPVINQSHHPDSSDPAITASVAKPALPAGQTPSDPTDSHSLAAPIPAITPVHSHWQPVSVWQATATGPSSPVTPAVHPPAAPSQPLPVSGALASFQGLLSQTLLPGGRQWLIQAAVPVARRLLPFLVIIILVGLTLPRLSGYVRTLRLSGFRLAPRSGIDASLLTLLPLNLGFVTAIGPTQSPVLMVRYQINLTIRERR